MSPVTEQKEADKAAKQLERAEKGSPHERGQASGERKRTEAS